tara:strand:+ start:178 stop:1374 length:1197 start_codon:yes stop_codon:yes gene_type:complete
MTILNNNNRPYFLTFGLEPEFVRPHYSNVNIHNEVDGVFAKSDGSLRDGGELELPIYADSNRAWEHIEKVFNVATNQYNCVSNSYKCSVHVHIGMRPIDRTIVNEQTFTNESINFAQSNNNIRSRIGAKISDYFGQPLPLEIARDVSYRIIKDIALFSTMLTPRRRDCYYAKYPSTTAQAIQNTQADINSLIQSISTERKYSAINLLSLAPNNYSNNVKYTMEFRSHSGSMDMPKLRNWIRFLLNLAYHSIDTRFVQAQSMLTTPATIARAGSKAQIVWSMARSENGASTQELMNASNIQSAQRIRVMMSEWRSQLSNSFGQNVIEMLSQQHFGHRYTTSNGRYDLNGYRIPTEIQSGNGSGYIFNGAGDPSIHAGMTQELLTATNARIQEIASIRSR